jgi:hypothetical protein
VGIEGAEPVRARRRPRKALLVQERALKNPPAYWALNVWKVVLGTRESRLGPAICGVAGSDAPPITGEPGKWRWRSSGSRSGSQYSEVGKAGHMGKDPRFIDAREGAEGP